MSIFDLTQTALERAMHGASLRQEALAQNMANANTPGYQRRDVDFHGALQRALAEGDANALRAVPMEATVDRSGALRADGNGVDVDVESATLAKNGMEYQALVQVARARNEILKSAMGAM